ncbi:CtpF protein [Georhizobium profundi]|jgi:pilus assembly protein CpaE|uniref:CtpF protein n=2 Tax=Rhizobiaceae TaxID=82115 RepID=A0A3Q8XKV9_9HYPH|nr:CtpF protein [Georhizobium profundi]
MNDSGIEGRGEMSESDIARGQIDKLRPLPRISIQAFFETEGLLRTIERCGEDRRMAKVNLRVNKGGLPAAINMFASHPTPNLIILESDGDRATLLGELEQLAEVCDASTKVVIVGHQNDVGLYRELIRNGISEYIVAPVSLADLIGVITAIFVDPEAEPLGRTIAFVGAKGGVGSSTMAHNCAFAISNLFSEEVILADLDMPFGTANINFDQDPPQGMSEAVYSPERLDDVFLDRLLAKCSERLSMLAAPSMLDRTYDFDPSAFMPMVEVVQRSAPVAVLDVPHIWTDWARNLLSSVDQVVITAVPDLANLRNTKNMLDVLKKMRPNDQLPHLVLNQVGLPKRPEITPADFCDPLGIEPIAILPFEAALFGSAANSGRMISEIDAKSATAETISQIAHVVTGRAEAKKRKKSGLPDLMSLLGRKKAAR